MAFASSMIEVKKTIIKHCDLCEDEEEVNWFCKNCNQNLCDRCKKIHPKIVSFKDHQLISLCQDHNEPFSFYCRQCDNSICSKCLSLIHKEHDLIEISVYQSELQDRLHDALTEKETENEQIKSTLDAIFKYEEECKKTLTESFAIIDERRKAIRQDVDEECEEMKTWLKTITDQQMKGVSENKRKVEERQFAYYETVQTVKRQLPLQTTTTLSQFVKTSICDFQSLKPLSYPIPRINTFVVGRGNKKYIREMIGSYSSTDDIPCQSGRLNKENAVLKQLQIVSMYELDAQIRCRSICTSPDGNIWISDKSFVYKMSPDCSTILLKIPTRDNGMGSNLSSYIACLKSGDAVLFYDKSFHIYLDKFTSDGRREEFTRLLPYFPYMYGMTVSKQDEVIIAAGEKTRRRFYKRIEIFSNEGKRLNSISVTK
ncbi:hypothetical protein FSP39_023137 [Pinctada imbricata]|uniref:B box-type domain-containing protein n=1 Tax=Pinctada imbricata TaxID=66713 RepID=A0AA89BXY3_PINIB|nr:hypothetical protein FSP39_023137 [Pinctada imbricata]